LTTHILYENDHAALKVTSSQVEKNPLHSNKRWNIQYISLYSSITCWVHIQTCINRRAWRWLKAQSHHDEKFMDKFDMKDFSPKHNVSPPFLPSSW